MHKYWRDHFNKTWTDGKYQYLYQHVKDVTGHLIPFRLAESPVFLENALWDKLIQSTEDLIDQITDEKILVHGEKVFDFTHQRVPNDTKNPHFIQFDFGICLNENGDLQPKLIELQGFPSLYYYQPLLAQCYKSIFEGSEKLKFYADGFDQNKYYEILDTIILNGHSPENVIILELEPEKQNTYIDLLCTSLHLGVPVLCISKVKRAGKNLFYINTDGKAVEIKRIYNRVIFDELDKRQDLIDEYDMLQEVDVEWAGHPNWFFKLSKFSMPLLSGEAVPKTYFLNEVDYTNLDLSKYVCKPLFSFSGSGVEIDITKEMLDAYDQKHHYILQEKVEYVPLVEDPHGELAKFEVRMMCVWPDYAKRPIIVNNLVRLSKGKMVGVKYNKDKIWVGGSIAFRE